jgi:hypothetical protein
LFITSQWLCMQRLFYHDRILQCSTLHGSSPTIYIMLPCVDFVEFILSL